jgi:hypothetical protein
VSINISLCVRELKERVNLPILIGEYVRLKRSGPSLLGLCPFHNEKTPSFYVHPTYYKCFGCGRAGDAIDFLRAIDGLSFRDALRRLAERVGVSLDETPDPEYRQRKAVASELAGECRYWVAIGGFAREMRRLTLPKTEFEAYEWCAANPHGDAAKWEAAWVILSSADPAPWDACYAAIRGASPEQTMEAYLKWRNPEFRRLYRAHVAERERENAEARVVCRQVVGVLDIVQGPNPYQGAAMRAASLPTLSLEHFNSRGHLGVDAFLFGDGPDPPLGLAQTEPQTRGGES